MAQSLKRGSDSGIHMEPLSRPPSAFLLRLVLSKPLRLVSGDFRPCQSFFNFPPFLLAVIAGQVDLHGNFLLRPFEIPMMRIRSPLLLRVLFL